MAIDSFPENGFMVVPINGGPVKFMTYHEYIASDEWYERVTQYKDVAGWTCEECGATDDITGHHKHYLNLGNEPPEDIEILCWDCHRERH
jgi:5-methylcytosine-specific restriction endonuclease McrA